VHEHASLGSSVRVAGSHARYALPAPRYSRGNRVVLGPLVLRTSLRGRQRAPVLRTLMRVRTGRSCCARRCGGRQRPLVLRTSLRVTGRSCFAPRCGGDSGRSCCARRSRGGAAAGAAPSLRGYSFSSWRTVITGQGACWTTLSAVEPRRRWARPVRPWVPMAMRSAPRARASSTMTSGA